VASESNENFLVAIYRLTREQSHAHTKDIAASLGVTPPTVSQRITRLAEQGYLDHNWRKGVALTDKGRLFALKVLRKHRLIETFLVHVLHFPIDEVNDEACQLEHVVSDRFIEAIDILLEHPEVDPHGHPIPSEEGAVAFYEYQSLADVLPGTTVIVKQVSDRDQDQLHYLLGLGIVPGAMITMLEVAPFGGPMTLEADGKTVTISQAIARKVSVTSPEDPEPAKK
jgi:DtxR family Mn-dependent transcriptional regulator